MSVRVLYVQHAGALGGSVMSLKYLLQGLDRDRFTPVVALLRPDAKVAETYRSIGVEVLEFPGISTFEHTNLEWWSLASVHGWRGLGGLARDFRSSMDRTRALVSRVKPDLVHLNSAVLLPSALALKDVPVPVVWHVREPPPDVSRSVRTAWFRREFRSNRDAVIFLSETERAAWMDGPGGDVVPNGVDLSRFMPPSDRSAAKSALGLRAGSKVVAFLGGTSSVKGLHVLLAALRQVRVAGLACVMPGTERVVVPPPRTPIHALLGRERRRLAALERRFEPLEAASVVRRLPLTKDVTGLLAAADVLVFPAIRPHFARPVIEAGAMGVPSVVSDSPLLRELVVEGETGLLVPAGDAHRLADAITALLSDEATRARLGEAARMRALDRHDAATTAARVIRIYDRVLTQSRRA